VKARFSNSINELTHINYDRISNISADIKDEKELNRILADLKTELNTVNWEPGYFYSFKGDFENRDQSFGQLGYATVIAILIILTILMIITAAKTRLVPVLMTSVTTILGLIFLALNGGSLWTPMAITIIGGLIGTTFFVLILIPILFFYVSRFLVSKPKTSGTDKMLALG